MASGRDVDRSMRISIMKAKHEFRQSFGVSHLGGQEEKEFITNFFDVHVKGVVAGALKNSGGRDIDFVALLAPAREKLKTLLDQRVQVLKKQQWCLVCEKEAELQCGEKWVSYCSEECQHLHWHNGHKKECNKRKNKSKDEEEEHE